MLSIGLIIGLLGVGLLVVAIVLQFIVAGKQPNSRNNIKTGLRRIAVFTIVLIIIYLAGLFLAYYFSGAETVSKGAKFIADNPQLLALAA